MEDCLGADIVTAAFSRPVFRALAEHRPAPAGVRRALAGMVDSITIRDPDFDGTLAEAYQAAYRELALHYRCEYYFKAQVVTKIVWGRHSPKTASALLEVRMGSSIADVVVVNGTTTAYEIKTDLDNFDRLAGQLVRYATRAEYTNVVVSEVRADRALTCVPPWVGVLALRGNGALAVRRPAESRIDSLVPEHQFHLLRIDEARRAVYAATGVLHDEPAGRAWATLRGDFAALEPAVANAAVVRQLHGRGAGAAQLITRAGFPVALRAMAYAQPMSRAAGDRLLEALGRPAKSFADG